MAGVKTIEIPVEQKISGDCWEFYKRNYYPEEGEVFWDNLREEALEISRKYQNHSLAIKILVAYMDLIEQRYKESEANEQKQSK